MPPFLLPGEPTISVAVEKVTERKEHKVLMADLQISHLQGHMVGENPSKTAFPWVGQGLLLGKGSETSKI